MFACGWQAAISAWFGVGKSYYAGLQIKLYEDTTKYSLVLGSINVKVLCGYNREKYMGTTKNEEAVTWTEKAEPESVGLSRGCGVAGGESEFIGNQQKRDNRAYRSESSIFGSGTAVTGGVLDNLIEEYCDQVQLKENEIQRLNDEVNRLKSRVQEFRVLRGELQKQFQEAS